MIHEHRIYRVMPGRMPDQLRQFEDVILPIWERLGIRQAGFWTVLIGQNNNDLHYLLAWESLAEREAKWAAFLKDPAWLEGRKAAEAPGPLLTSLSSAFLQPTTFSSVR